MVFAICGLLSSSPSGQGTETRLRRLAAAVKRSGSHRRGAELLPGMKGLQQFLRLPQPVKPKLLARHLGRGAQDHRETSNVTLNWIFFQAC